MMFRHIRTRMLVFILPIVLVTVLFFVIISVNAGKNIINSQISERMKAEQLAEVSNIENKLQQVKGASLTLATFVSKTYQNSNIKTYEEILEEVVQMDSFFLGAGIWFEPYTFAKEEEFLGPYVYKADNELVLTYEYSNATYNYFLQEYYRNVKKTKRMVLTKPYYDSVSNLYMLSCSSPILDQDGNFLGCVTVDIQLSEMQKLVNSLITKEGGSAFIIDNEGYYLAATDISRVESGMNIKNESNESFQEIGRKIINNQGTGITSFSQGKETYRLYYTNIPQVNWNVVFQIPASNIVSPVYELAFILSLIGIAAIIIISGNILFISARSVSNPIKVLVNEFGLIASGTYEEVVPNELMQRKDEVGILGRALYDMKIRLSQSKREIEEMLEESNEARQEVSRQNERLKISELHLRESNTYNQSIIKVIPDVLFIISRDGIFLDCQGSMDTVLYLPKEEFIGKSIKDVIPKEIAETGMQKIEDAFFYGTLQSFDYELEIEGQREVFELRIIQCFEDKVMAIVRGITDEHKHLKQIEYLSYHDQVTRLYNRRFYEEELKHLDVLEFLPFCVIIADINGLKLVNDSFGHNAGDLLLGKFAQVLQSTCPKTDRIARIGGDEFAVLLPNTTEKQVEKIVQSIMENCEKENVNAITLSVSLGWGIKLDRDEELMDILKSAEDMMYKKKLLEAPSRRGKTIELIINTLHEKNPREEQHSHRVAELCEKLAIELKLPDHEKGELRSAGLLHDIGKIAIPEELLNKPGKLTREEYGNICRHPEIGYRILCSAHDMSDIAEFVFAHHERWDGKGYPRGLKEEEIPVVSRMIAIADAYDAMTSARSYRFSFSEEEAAMEILKNAGVQFDPELAHRFVYDVLRYKPEEGRN
ncbi:MAG: HD domain-containing phosphohydrolase [Velocimicrobium sp.]